MTRVREVATETGLIVFGTVIVVVGRAETAALGIGTWITAVGLLLLVGRVLRDRERGGAGGRGQIATRVLDGEPAAVLHEHPARPVLGAVFAAVATVPFVALVFGAARLGVGAGAGEDVAVVVVLIALVVPVALTVGGQLRRALRAGIWLTPTALVVRERDVTSRVRWPDVRWIGDTDGPASVVRVVVRDSHAVTVDARRGRDRRLRAALGDISIRTGMFALDAPELVELLRACQEPVVAARLGSDAGLALVRESRRSRPATGS
ncbi:hypothetical protein MHY85_05665 [Cellulomonas sp. ACRRI]|uniref:hypothetical protein n=1 Tax=Cellulomonas sp. ACRRI TaxID=2918188 RepID=UPI001EF34F28|nr:hypothetical protein [Cellulomonas sp. ACRRI]MCG7285463.1 hypothetical protein [Cellulomonas sp. ACRRI]